MIVHFTLLLLYLYGIFAGGRLVKGTAKNVVFILVNMTLFFLNQLTPWPIWGTLAILFVTEVFLYYYSETVFGENWLSPFIYGGWLLLMNLTLQSGGWLTETVAVILMLELLFLGLSYKRNYLRVWNAGAVTLVYALLIYADLRILVTSPFVLIAIATLVFALLETTLRGYEKGFLHTTKELREQMLSQQYHEIQAIYLNMRGWRHDYHNHIQVLKATLDQNQVETARGYLDGIEDALRKVDTYVKSGNVMADAIINSKLTLAEQKHIQITCDAFLPDDLFISDVDLCTILGNLLDNAIESCDKVAKSERFVRIYLAMQKEQLYLSIQNAALEEMDFEQKHFISTKRGNHGLGIKRVAAVVNKWNGYISLNQEPGVFATEIMIPNK